MACGILVPQPGIEPGPLVVMVQSCAVIGSRCKTVHISWVLSPRRVWAWSFPCLYYLISSSQLPVRWIVLFSPTDTWENQGPERFHSWLKVTDLINEEPGFNSQLSSKTISFLSYRRRVVIYQWKKKIRISEFNILGYSRWLCAFIHSQRVKGTGEVRHLLTAR